MLQVSLLGERTLIDAATARVLARSPRTLALVGYLAAHGGTPQPRGRIAAAFWPDSTEQQALTNLRRELHQLRRVLAGDPSLVVTAADLTWRDTPGCRVDLRAFRVECRHAADAEDAASALFHGRAALAAYGGEFLPGLYDDWVLEVREQLVRECIDLCQLVVDVARRAGDGPTALAAARRRIDLRPLEETGYRQLIDLQVELGDRAGAVSTYHHCASVLEDELGLQPHPRTRAALDVVVPHPPFRRGSVAPPPDLVGRDREFAALDESLQAALAGGTRIVVVRGEPGVGKSRLVAELARRARDATATVATAQCYAGTGRLALAPVVDWLRDPAVRSRVADLDPSWRAEVERLVPETPPRGQPVAPRGLGDAWQRHRFFQGLSRALLAGARTLVLVLDNLQWCDADTLDLLAFLAGEHEHGLMVLAAGRAQELAGASAHADWLRRMRSTGALRELDLPPLRREETALLGAVLGGTPLTDSQADELHAATGGFPLFVVEAARAGGVAVPAEGAGPTPAVDSVLHARLGQLGPDSREVAGLAAATGRDFDLPLLCEASDLPPEAVVRALDELWRLR
ncbi:MAG TPA: AAA family ATPase, partial [Marmoricola sp.]|nr:AAA family ATPase [Marmoricola sp.]